MSIETMQAQLGYRNLTMDDICKLQRGLQWYIRETHPGTCLEQRRYDELRRIEADPALALKYYSEHGRNWINTHLQRCNHFEIFEHLSSIEWKVTEEGPNSDTNEFDIGQTADVQSAPDPVDDDDHNNEQDGDEFDSVASLTWQIAAMGCESSFSTSSVGTSTVN